MGPEDDDRVVELRLNMTMEAAEKDTGRLSSKMMAKQKWGTMKITEDMAGVMRIAAVGMWE